MINPIELFETWFDEARRAGIPYPETMTLATATRGGSPSARIVLFKGMLRGAFSFYTNYESRKGRELDANPRAALIFYWEALQRQVRIEGRVSRATKAESDRYFASRERGSQIGAWASPQSQTIRKREELEERVHFFEEKFKDRAVPRPPHWGGYRVIPERIEFWQGKTHRLHERTVFERKGRKWASRALSP